MPFIHAVFCLKGFDDRNRFFVTALISIIGFMFFSAVLSSYVVVNMVILLLLTTVLTLSTKRRLHDAKLNKNWQLVPGGLLLLSGILSLFIDNTSSYYLLILPILSIALLLTYPSKNQRARGHYILGYYGPIDLNIYIKESTITNTHSQRIEPTWLSENASEQLHINENLANQRLSSSSLHSDLSANQSEDEHTNQVDIGELIRLKFLSNRKFQLGIITSVSLIFIGVFSMSAFNVLTLQDNDTSTLEADAPLLSSTNRMANIVHNKSHFLAMPDGFDLYLTEYQGIIIHWQADQVDNGELWSLLSASGDKSCQRINFNKGDSIRPLAVLVENGNDYFANFSPVDSEELVQALAFRGNFSLCGYRFSLKGSQAVLGKNNQYAHFLDKDA